MESFPSLLCSSGLHSLHGGSGQTDRRKGRRTVCVPEDSILGQLWNTMYNDPLDRLVPKESTAVAYADDIVIVVIAKRLGDAL